MRRDKATYGDQVVYLWHTDTNEHFGILVLDVENALFLWLEEEFSPTGSVKALSRAAKLSQAWKSSSLSPVCL